MYSQRFVLYVSYNIDERETLEIIVDNPISKQKLKKVIVLMISTNYDHDSLKLS